MKQRLDAVRKKTHPFFLQYGESLMEVLIAVGVLMMIIGPAAGLYVGSNRQAAMQKNMLIAEQLASEGVDLVRAVRDTNLTSYKSKSQLCWLTKPNAPTAPLYAANPTLDACNANILSDGSYKVEYTIMGTTITSAGAALSPDLTAPGDAQFMLQLNPQGLYTHDVNADNVPSPFYREVTLEIEDIDNPPNVGADSVVVTSRVAFKLGSKTQSATATSVLFAP